VARIVCVMGTRPEAIKLCPLALRFRERGRHRMDVCAAAQHRQMLNQVLDVFGVIPAIDLDLMRQDQSPNSLASRALAALDQYLRTDVPDLVIVQGDTTTSLCAALAAFHLHVAIGHVEAGLRTNDKYAPFPEEINRVLISRLADLHFAPTATSRDNLQREGVDPARVFVTGNTVIDALQIAIAKVRERPPELPGLPPELLAADPSRPLILITAHRRESFGGGLANICRAVSRLAAELPETAFIYPVHLNPQVRKPVFELLRDQTNVYLLPPLDYLQFVTLLDRAVLILTDSGGIQEEAPALGKPVLVMREKTERPEALAAGTAILVGTEPDCIVSEARRLLTDSRAYEAMAGARNPFGDGRASQRILQVCEDFLARPGPG
jgi:UDP-N-acetylglucosamine 2-epimerase (non-hydrolysing)